MVRLPHGVSERVGRNADGAGKAAVGIPGQRWVWTIGIPSWRAASTTTIPVFDGNPSTASTPSSAASVSRYIASAAG